MRITITGKNMEVSEYLHDTITKKLSKLNRYFKPETNANIMLSMQRSRHIVEVTIPFDGVVIRAEEATGDMYASIDSVVDKLIRQITKHRTKLSKRLKADSFPENQQYEDFSYGKLVRHKQFSLKPMSVEEAIMQLELLGHEFFIFSNQDTERINVLYRRKDGNYGVLEPEYG
ncbi:MAG: ribosome hibernation-promoting factor, HPF/YfiA family [Christensenellales bacterium]|jgi:putative sigma-54 modulation protein